MKFEDTYKHITAWIYQCGYIEIGTDEYSESMVRALDEGGMVFEGQSSYA